MSQRTQTVCDECQVVKKESNHWHSVGLYASNALLVGSGANALAGEMLISVADLCGDSCLHKFIDRKLQIGAHRPPQIVEENNGEE